MLGKCQLPFTQAIHPDQAGKITGMLLKIDNTELTVAHVGVSGGPGSQDTRGSVCAACPECLKEMSAEMKN